MSAAIAAGAGHVRSLSESLPKESAPAATRPATAPSAEPSAFARLVHGLGKEVNGGEAMMRAAAASASGAKLDTGQLIALQAAVYRYSEAIDLASKLVDHASSSVKTVIQGSGQ